MRRIKLSEVNKVPQTSTTPRKRVSLSSINNETEAIAPEQKFFIDFTERSFFVKFGHQQFGVMKHDGLARFENQLRNCESSSQKEIVAALAVMKTYLKAGMGFDTLKKRMSANDALFAPTLKVFVNKLNKPVN